MAGRNKNHDCTYRPQVRHNDGLAERRLVVLSRALVAVSACTNLEIEGAIHLVFFRAVNASQMLCSSSRPGIIVIAMIHPGKNYRICVENVMQTVVASKREAAQQTKEQACSQ